MESNSKWSYIITVLLVASIPNTAKCQFLDWLVDYAVDEVVGNTVSSWWNSYLDSEAKDAVQKRASRLAEWPLDQDAINGPDRKYNMRRTANPYSSNYSVLSERTNSYFNSVQNVTFSSLAKGKIGKSSTFFMDSIKTATIISNLESVVSKNVLDSVNTYNVNRQMLLNDIKSDKRLALLLNNHPELVRIYNNTKDTKLKSDCISLLYWGVLANEHANNFPAKTKFINGKNVTFSNQGNEVALRYKDSNIATINGRNITCKDVNLMNLRPMPNMIYSYGLIKYYTDNMGRVVKVEQFVGSNTKGKNTQKSILAGKKFNNIKNGFNQLGMPYSLGLLKHQAPDCGINTIFIEKSAENKDVLKLLKKKIKSLEKSGYSKLITTEVSYDTGSDQACGACVSIDGEDFTLGAFRKQASSQPNEKSKESEFLKELKAKKVVKSVNYNGNIAGTYEKETTSKKETVMSKKETTNFPDGYYCFEGSWMSQVYTTQPCRIEFHKKGNSLLLCEYTNLKFNSTIKLSGTISNDHLRFVGKINGKELIIELQGKDTGYTVLEGKGVDKAHNDTANLKLSRK